MTEPDEERSPDRLLGLKDRVFSLLSRGVGAIDVAMSRDGAHSAYVDSVSPFLRQALEEIDVALDLTCSHLLVTDIHDPERLLVSTSAAKHTVFRVRISVDSQFLAELASEKAGQEMNLERRAYSADRLWELLWQTMILGPYAGPWSLVGFPLSPSSISTNDLTEAAGFLIFVGRKGWYAETAKECSGCFSVLLPQFALTAQVMRTVSRLTTLAEWMSPALTDQLTTAGRLHGMLAPLQRLELKVELAARLLERSRPRDEILARFREIRSEIDDVRRCVRDFLDTRAVSQPLQKGGQISPMDYAQPKQVIDKIVKDLRELADRDGKQFLVRVSETARLVMTSTDLELIVANLVHNAVKYGDPNTQVKINCERRGRKAVIEVTSYGFGISAAEQDRIFEPGYRTAEASRVEFTAAGLGLFAARRAAERWGGHLFLRSSERKVGTSETYRNSFRLELSSWESPPCRQSS